VCIITAHASERSVLLWREWSREKLKSYDRGMEDTAWRDILQVTVFWNQTLCILIDVFRSFGEMWCLHLHGIVVSREWKRSDLIWGGGGPDKSPKSTKGSEEKGECRMPLKEPNHVLPCSG
jgi:hypothetical protein